MVYCFIICLWPQCLWVDCTSLGGKRKFLLHSGTVLFLSPILSLWACRLCEEQNAVVIREGEWEMDLAVFGATLMCMPFDSENFSEKEEILLDVTSRLWFTYRKNFPAIGMYCG